jgi:hypothetical protein
MHEVRRRCGSAGLCLESRGESRPRSGWRRFSWSRIPGEGNRCVESSGGRYALEDDGETPDMQEALFTYPGFVLSYAIRETSGYRGDSASRGLVFHGTKGALLLSGSYEIVPEMHGDPFNSIP